MDKYRITALDKRGYPNIGNADTKEIKRSAAAGKKIYTEHANGYAQIAQKKREIRQKLGVKRTAWYVYNESKKKVVR